MAYTFFHLHNVSCGHVRHSGIGFYARAKRHNAVKTDSVHNKTRTIGDRHFAEKLVSETCNKIGLELHSIGATASFW